jgi:hypothetical protein
VVQEDAIALTAFLPIQLNTSTPCIFADPPEDEFTDDYVPAPDAQPDDTSGAAPARIPAIFPPFVCFALVLALVFSHSHSIQG